MRRNPALAHKKIRFYRADLGFHADGNQVELTPAMLDPMAALRFDDGTAYYEDGEHVTSGWLDRAARPIHVRIADIRRADFPLIEIRGEVHPLVIDPDSGLAETTHVVFFDNNIVGAEFNFYGPRPTRVAKYLRSRVQTLARLQLIPLLRGDVVAQLDRLQDIRLFHVSILPPYLDQVAATDRSLADALRGLAALGEVGRAEVVLRPIPYSRRSLGQRMRTILRGLASRRDILEGAEVLKTSGYNPDLGRVEEVDLLRDEFVAEREVPRAPAPSRGVESSAMYAAITEAHADLRDELERAAGVHVS